MQLVGYCGMEIMGAVGWSAEEGQALHREMAGENGGGHGFWSNCYFVYLMPQTLSVRMTKKY